MTSGLLLHQPGFVPANARRLAQASADAYTVRQASGVGTSCPHTPRPDAQAEDVETSCPHPELITCPETDTHVTVTRHDDCTVIAFRGTKDLANWITDAEFLREHIPTGGVHRGFLAAVDSVLPLIKDCLSGAGTACPQLHTVGTARPLPVDKKNLKPLVLTGHSLGGALAIVCGYFLAEQDYPLHSIYTYGQPRVGDAAFAADFAVLCGWKTYRVVNQNDVVPRLPGWLLGYRHVGQLQFITEFGQLVADAPLWVMALSDALGLWQAWRLQKDVLLADHFIESYIAKLARAGG
jgi:hypothetical protein